MNVLAKDYVKNQSDPLYATCMDVIVRANEKIYAKEGHVMCEAIRELMFKYYGDQLEVDRAKMRQEVEVEVRQEVCRELEKEIRKLTEDTNLLTIIDQIRKRSRNNLELVTE